MSAAPTSVDLVIHNARLLKLFDSIYSHQSPFCEISVDGAAVDRTATHKSGDLKPIWKQRFGILIPPNTTHLILRVYIEHSIRVPKLCGECFIPITAIPEELTDFALKLEKREEKTGEIDVSIQKIASAAARGKMKAEIGQHLFAHLSDMCKDSPKARGAGVPQLPQPHAGAQAVPLAPSTADLKANVLRNVGDSMRQYAHKVFAAFDTTPPPNALQLHEYKAACHFIARDLSVPSPGDEVLARIFKKYDVDGDDVLNREEFVEMLSVLLRKVQAAQAAQAAPGAQAAQAAAQGVQGAQGAQAAQAAPTAQVQAAQRAPQLMRGQQAAHAAPAPQAPRAPQAVKVPQAPPTQAARGPTDTLRTESRFIDVYSYGKKLGEGSFGVVYQCRARLTKLERVCKVVNKVKCQMPIAEIKMEVKLLAQLDHPHIQRVFEYFEDHESFYFIFDPCEGGELMDVVKAANDRHMMLTEDWVAKVMRGTLLALGYVHKRHIMHKDLKLQNVLLLNRTNPYDDPHAIVIDFGLAEIFADNQSNTRVAGTPSYMAPEVWNRSFGPKCDVWSSGVMIFFLLTGQLPFTGNSMNDLRARIMQGAVPWQALAHNTKEAREIVQSMLQVDDSRRPSASRCVTHSWFVAEKTEKTKVTLSKDILQNLSKVTEMAQFEKAVSQLVAKQMSNKHMNEIIEMFKALDVDNNGVLTLQELSVGLRKLGIDDATIPQVASALDSNNTGYVSYTEFCGGMLAGIMQDRDHLLWIGFQQLDETGSGRIEAKTLERALVARGIGKLDVSAESLVTELDVERTGYVTWENFRAYFRRAHTGVRDIVSYREA